MSTRTLVFLFCGSALVFLGGMLSRKASKDESERPPPAITRQAADVVDDDGPTVFQRAFWRRPQEGDVILNAERREWLDGEEVERWQWYLLVEPSEELLRALRDDNSFGLQKGILNPELFQDAPEWFQGVSSDFDCRTAPDGGMTLFFGSERLYATGQGGGFQAGAERPTRPEKEAVPTSREPSGRLPNQSPPKP